MCLPGWLVSGRRKAQSAGEGGMAVGIEGRGAQNARRERVRVGQMDDEGSGRMLDDAGDSQTSKPKAVAALQ